MNAATFPDALAPAAGRRTIGDILVSTGRLTVEDVALIAKQQRKDNSKFGDAAIALKLLTKSDIDFALSQQFDYVYLPDKDTSVSPELVAAYRPFSRVGEDLRAVRSQLMLRWFNSDAAHKVMTVVSPDKAEGRSFIAANLAIVFAQQGQRTLLIDADLRDSRQHRLFKLQKTAGLSGILAGRAGMETAASVAGLEGLYVLAAGAAPPNPQELLGRAAFGGLLKLAAEQFEVVIIDTPAGAAYADAEIIAARAGAGLMVARKNQSLLSNAAKLSRRLLDGGVALVGAVINDD